MKLTAIVFSITTVLACSVGADTWIAGSALYDSSRGGNDDTVWFQIDPHWLDSLGANQVLDSVKMFYTKTEGAYSYIKELGGDWVVVEKAPFNWSPSTLINNYDWKVEV